MTPSEVDQRSADVPRHYKLAGALMFVWALKWFSGPVVFMLQRDQFTRVAGASHFGFGAVYFRHGANLVGLAVAVAAIVAGIGLRKLRPDASSRARWALLAIVVYQALLVMGPALVELLMARGNSIAVMHTGPVALLVCGAALPDIICAAALIWFLGGTDRPDPPEGEAAVRGRVAGITSLAILVLVAREGLRIILAPADVQAFIATLAAGFDAPVYAAVLAIGVVTALGSLVLALAWLTGARSLAAPTMTLLLLVLLRLVISLGLPSISGFPDGPAGLAMMTGLAVSSVANLAEYGMLMFAVEGVVRRESA